MEKQQYPSLSFFGKERFTPLVFSKDTFIFNWEITPGHGVMEHIHPNVDETFEITQGEITFKIEGKTRVAKVGETLTIAKGIPHEIKNVSKDNAACKVSYYPAGDQGNFFDTGLFLLNENPAINGSAGMVFKMMYISKQMGFEEFSEPANKVVKVVLPILWVPIKLYAEIAGWRKIFKRYKKYKTLTTA
ncbi:MAG: cupin domain-containing protein [Sphingobacteriales bacterium JAD_PAG50586_3]|nr:MAG: cupin domain-containing protein [Sphingobacteriales bacterium JAD_PAG50586_3]